MNNNICQAIISNKNGNHRCKYQIKSGEYCGRHKNYDLKQIKNNIKKPTCLNKFTSGIFTYQDYRLSSSRVSKLKINQIKNTCKYYKLTTIGSKNELTNQLIKLFENFKYYELNLDKIIKIQSLYRGWKIRNIINLQGIYIFNKSLCNNQEEFYTFDEINNIEDNFFFSIKENTYIYGFDIRSLSQMIDNSNGIILNPYTNQEININDIIRANIFIKYLEKNNIIVKHVNTVLMSPEQEINLKATEIFQKMDYLGNYIDLNWFHQMNIHNLKSFYKLLEDIWNYRANLSDMAKLQIVPQNNLFTMDIYTINNITDKIKLQHIILDTINTLVSSGITQPDKTIGAFYVQATFAGIVPEASDAMPYMAFVISNSDENTFY